MEHRNEFVRSINGVSFYNDSIGSSPTRTTATIKAFNNKVILIAGGYDKNLCYDNLGEIIYNHVKAMVLLGDTAEKIEQSYKKYLGRSHNSTIPVIKAKDMEDAVKKHTTLQKVVIVLFYPLPVQVLTCILILWKEVIILRK